MAQYDIGFQPKDLIPNVVFSPEGGTLSEDEAKLLGDRQDWMSGPHELLCRACGWTTYHEMCTDYLPRLRIFHARPNSGLWHMGNDWLIWDRPGDKGTRTNEYMTYRFLREKGTKNIPLVKEMHQFGNEGDQFVFTITPRVKGVNLESVWTTLTSQEKRCYADQLIAALRELRQFTAPSPQRADGSPLSDNIISACWPPKICRSIPDTKEKWLSNVEEELRVGVRRKAKSTYSDNKPTPEGLYHRIQTTFPESAPFVLTHADLNMSNIMVHDGKILAIIDWEYAGYYPWWVERWASYRRAPSGNAEELFDMVWAEVSPELSPQQFIDEVYDPVEDTAMACHFAAVEHTQSHDLWLRPRWCECKAYAGHCKRKDWDAELKHGIDYNVDTRAFENPMKSAHRYPAVKK